MPEPKTRQDYLDTADKALQKAEQLADYAESAAHHPDHRRTTANLAAAGALYADIARSAAAIAQAMPEDAQDAPEDTNA
jgi:pterin-4a-carbinolamine dehydratase